MTKRAYTQIARAEATENTRRALIDAVHSLFLDDGVFDPPLDQVAGRAGVSTRTLLRHFGTKEGLIHAAIEDAAEQVAEARDSEPGDADTAIRLLVDHYEASGDRTMSLLAEAERSPAVRRATEAGKAVHLRWVETLFAPTLDGLGAEQRQERTARLAAVTDLYQWHLLRRRYGLSRERTEVAIRELVEHEKGTR